MDNFDNINNEVNGFNDMIIDKFSSLYECGVFCFCVVCLCWGF